MCFANELLSDTQGRLGADVLVGSKDHALQVRAVVRDRIVSNERLMEITLVKRPISFQFCPTTFCLLFYPFMPTNPYLYMYFLDTHHIIQEMTTKTPNDHLICSVQILRTEEKLRNRHRLPSNITTRPSLLCLRPRR
jgi:hypothetical protein